MGFNSAFEVLTVKTIPNLVVSDLLVLYFLRIFVFSDLRLNNGCICWYVL